MSNNQPEQETKLNVSVREKIKCYNLTVTSCSNRFINCTALHQLQVLFELAVSLRFNFRKVVKVLLFVQKMFSM